MQLIEGQKKKSHGVVRQARAGSAPQGYLDRTRNPDLAAPLPELEDDTIAGSHQLNQQRCQRGERQHCRNDLAK